MSATSPGAQAAGGARTAPGLFAAVVGAVFLVVGVLGFIPGVTTNYGSMQFAGSDSQAMLLGVFQVSILHNIVHLLFGFAGLTMARTAGAARAFLVPAASSTSSCGCTAW